MYDIYLVCWGEGATLPWFLNLLQVLLLSFLCFRETLDIFISYCTYKQLRKNQMINISYKYTIIHSSHQIAGYIGIFQCSNCILLSLVIINNLKVLRSMFNPKKSTSLIKKHKLIQSQLRNFPSLSPSFTHKPDTKQLSHKSSLYVSKNSVDLKTKKSLKRGKSLEAETKEFFAAKPKCEFQKHDRNKIKKCLKKVGTQKMKDESYSRISNVTSEPTLSFPSSHHLSLNQAEFLRTMEENKELRALETVYKQVIEKQKKHINELEKIVESWE